MAEDSHVPGEGTEIAGAPDAEVPSSRRSGPRLVAVLAVALVAVAVVAGLVLGGGGEADQPPGTSTTSPSAALDSALAAGTPIYILIHSST